MSTQLSASFLKEGFSHHAFLEGTLAKQGRSFPSWKKRYFVLTMGKLSYYKTFAGNDNKRGRVFKGALEISKGKIKLLGIWKDDSSKTARGNSPLNRELNGENSQGGSSSDDELQHGDADAQTNTEIDQDSDNENNTMTSQEYIVVDDTKSCADAQTCESSKLTLMISGNSSSATTGSDPNKSFQKVPKLERVSKHWRGFPGYEQYKYKISIETPKRILNLAARTINECRMWLIAFRDCINTENYLNSCEALGVAPIWQICKYLSCSSSKLRNCFKNEEGPADENKSLSISLIKENGVTLNQIKSIFSIFGSNVSSPSEDPQMFQNLTINFCHLSDAYLPEISEKVAQMESVKVLDLAHNNFSGPGVSTLIDGLLINSSLTELNLESNNLGDIGAFHVSEYLMGNPSMIKLNISKNGVSQVGGGYLADAMKLNDSLEELNVSKNSFGDNGASALLKAICEKKTLKILDISLNEISEAGILKISETLSANSAQSFSLSEMDLRGNNCGSKIGLENFAKLLLNNSFSLKKIMFGENNPENKHNSSGFTEGIQKISDILKTNFTIPNLILKRKESVANP